MNLKSSSKKFFRFLLVIMVMIPALASSPLGAAPPAQEGDLTSFRAVDLSAADLEAKLGEPAPSVSIADPDHVGFYVPASYRWYMKTNTSDGWSGVVSFGWGGASELQAVVGDWDGDGYDTAAFYKPSQWRWYIKNDMSDGWAGVSTFQWGGNAEMIPISGDWDGDGDDTVGFYKPSASEWYLKNANTGGWTGFTKVVWGGAAGNIPIAGDWDGDGDDTIGFFVPSQNKWWLKNNLSDGWTGVTGFNFGLSYPMKPVVGDWDGDGDDTVGAYVPSKWSWFLKDDQVSGWSNVSIIRYGGSADVTPITGKWEGSTPPPTCYSLTRLYTGSGSAPTASPTNSSGCPTGTYTAGQAITLTPHPAAGWGLDYWTGTNCTSCSFFTMPATGHTVTAHYEQTSPTTLRIINDLYGATSPWTTYHSMVWLKVAPYCSSISWDSFWYPSGGTELLYDYNTIDPDYFYLSDTILTTDSGASYRDFDISGITTAPDGSYCVLIQSSYWQYIALYDLYEKTPTKITCCDGTVGACGKGFKIQIIKPYGNPEVITVSDWLPPFNTWVGHWSCP